MPLLQRPQRRTLQRRRRLSARLSQPCPGAVSYTHLDVYKRQPHRFSMASRVDVMEPPASPATMMVWMLKSLFGSKPFSFAISPRCHA